MANSPRARRRPGASTSGRLRIVAGKWRGRLVPVADVDGLRPTAARIRETLFNWLAPVIDGAKCLDVCAGSGALGLEALSRGASTVTFIEQSRVAAAGLRSAADGLAASGADVVTADAVAWLASATPVPHDIVFVDPPYKAALLGDLCRLLDSRGWLAPDARVYVEQDRKQPPAELPQHWRVLKDKKAGNVNYQLLTPAEVT